MPIGQRLKDLRQSNHMTQAQVAEGINCTPAAYTRYETGDREPSIEMLATLAEYFGVSLDYLYGRAPLNDSPLSDFERELIGKLRNVPESVKEDVMDFLDVKLAKDKN